MTDFLQLLWHGTRDALLMGWEVWWALALGFLISAIVQAWVPRKRIEASLSGSGAKPVALSTGLGAASSSCSYAAVAIGKSIFQKGASAASMLAFQFASTNLVWELGMLIWLLIGWQFALAEYIGGIVMIALSGLLLRTFISPALEARAHKHAIEAEPAHQHQHGDTCDEQLSFRQRLTSLSAWTEVAGNFRSDWKMVWREIVIGLLIAGFVAQLNEDVFNSIFLTDAPGFVQVLWGAFIGPVIAIATFVCSVGNVPLAAVLWSGGISFAGVIAFIFADLLILPIVAMYRKYYGTAFALRLSALMLVALIAAALIVYGAFALVGLVPSGPRPESADMFGSVHLDYKFVLNVIGLLVFVALFALSGRRAHTRRTHAPAPTPAHQHHQ